MEVLVPMRNLCDSPNYDCKHYHMVNSSIGFYSPSWTYFHLDSSPQVAAMEGFYNPSLTCMPRVSLLAILLFMWGFHLLTIQTHWTCNPAV